MKKYGIRIAVDCANSFQEETIMQFIEIVLSTMKGITETKHKKNKFNYKIIKLNK